MKNKMGLLLALAAAVLTLASDYKHKQIIGTKLVQCIVSTSPSR